MKRPKQFQFFRQSPRFFGGQLLQGRRKDRRPLSTRDPIHIVMRSTWAKGATSFRQSRNQKGIDRLIHATANRYRVRVYQKAISHNHLHLVVQVRHVKLYKAFIRVLSGRIATLVMQGRSFNEFLHDDANTTRSTENLPQGETDLAEPQGKGQKFWQFRPFSRVLHWGRDFKICCQYVMQNTLEALGFIRYTPRKDRYAKWIKETLEDPLEV